MQTSLLSNPVIKSADWYSEEFIYQSVIKFLKENGYKIHKNKNVRETERAGRIITASKFFRREVIEIKGSPYYYSSTRKSLRPRSTRAKSWFATPRFNSFVNTGIVDNAEVVMALPNVGRFLAIIKKLKDYFYINDLYLKIYLVNEDGSVDASNLNYKYASQDL